jgi:dihydroflavonol-4-reductase
VVTGASGFIGSHIVKQLLDTGHRVRGTVRHPERARTDGHLTSLVGAAEGLELVEADLLAPDAFDAAIPGCEYVIHTASPYAIDVEDPDRDLVQPALRGTLSILEACRSTPGVKRVVITSSGAAITDHADGHVNTEADWNTTSTMTHNPYYYSKTMAERAAWSFMEKHGPDFDLVVINPFFVIGPSLIPTVNTSHTSFIGLTNGRIPGLLALDWPLVDVRDVALAHIRAMTVEGAAGRYLLAADTRSVRQVVELLRANGWGDRYRLPTLSLDRGVGAAAVRLGANFQRSGTRSYLKGHLGGRMRFDNSKARRELGMEFRDVDRTILDAMEDLENWGHLGRRKRATTV